VNDPVNNWMRRRIERSRARCEKAATNHKTDKREATGNRPKLTTTSSLERDEKGG
jgi:hypothetical protein